MGGSSGSRDGRADVDGAHAPRGTPRRRLAVLLVLLLIPWTVVSVGDDLTLVFLPALVNYTVGPLGEPSVHVVPLWELFAAGGGLPRNAELWPASVVLFLVGLASAAWGALFGREDPRVTAGALLFAAVTHLGVTYAFLHRPAYTPFPVAPLLLAGVIWWYYWPALSDALFAPVGGR